MEDEIRWEATLSRLLDIPRLHGPPLPHSTILYSVDRTGSRLYPHYDPGVLHLVVLHSSIPLASTWGHFSLLHIHSTDIYRCGVRRFIFLLVVGARHL